MTRFEECLTKVESVRNELLNAQCCAIVIKRQSNFAWITGGGRGFIGLSSELACASLVVTASKIFLVANNIEAPRLLAEELPADFCFPIILDWPNDSAVETLFSEKFAPFKTDIELEPWFKSKRMLLDYNEQERFLSIGTAAASSLENACLQIRQGMSEFDVAAMVSANLWREGIEPITLLVAADNRSNYFRHYVPTAKTINEGVIVSICARSQGLIASATRIVAFTSSFATTYNDLLNVEQAIWAATTPEATLSSILETAKAAYATYNLADEWTYHHQGGPTGYMAREIRVDNTTAATTKISQAFAWNPSTHGSKCEDTILLTKEGIKILTPVSDQWPQVKKGDYIRPDILRQYNKTQEE